jgi:hypothetical protein
MHRHDAQRTGTASGTSDIASPVPYWKAYLGGSIGGTQFATMQLPDGETALLLVTEGRVTAATAMGQTLWQTPALNVGVIAGVADLDGDGKLDVVAYGNTRTYVVSSNGTLEWIEPAGEMGATSTVRVGDVDGDKHPDVIIQECGSCSGRTGVNPLVYAFHGGFAKATRAPLPFISSNRTLALLDPTGTGSLDVLYADTTHFAVVSGSGAVIASNTTVGAWDGTDDCYPTNLDGKPGDEAVCLLNSGGDPAGNGRAVVVLRYGAAAPPALDVLWSKVVAPSSGGDMSWVAPVADLDGDGEYEIVYATNDPTNGWQTHVADALTGVELVPPVPGQVGAGPGPQETAKNRDLLTTDVAATQTTAWSFARTPKAALTKRWTAPGTVPTYPSPAHMATQGDALTPLTPDLDGDGLADVLLTVPGVVSAVSGAKGSLKALGSLSLPPGVDLLRAWTVPPLTGSAPQVVVAGSDGVMSVLDTTLAVVTGPDGDPSRILFGGYYASGAFLAFHFGPRAAPLDGSAREAVLVDDSRQTLLRYDAAGASLAIPPVPAWGASHTFSAIVEPKLDGASPAIGCLAYVEPLTSPLTYQACVLSASGASKWHKPIAGAVFVDPVPGDFDKDGVPDFAVQTGAFLGSTLTTTAFSGIDGKTLWTTPLDAGAEIVEVSGLSSADWNHDGAPDVFLQAYGTYVLSGAGGGQLAKGGAAYDYATPVLYDTNGDGSHEVTLAAGYEPVAVYSADLATALFKSTDSDQPDPYPAIVQCGTSPAVPTLVEGSILHPARLKMTPLAGTSLGKFKTVVLAGGALYADETAATAAGATMGQLTSVSGHTNLTGKNRPSAVVGSSDGWLYGIDPCGGALDFAVPFGVAVGDAVFADTDGDGKDEILVTAADGYLYDLKNQAIAAPTYVWNTDPDHGITNANVATVITTDKLSATWPAVTGASSYQVEAVTLDGVALSTPVWQDVGNATSASLAGLSLADGARYRFAVRAVGPNGVSPDAVSAPVTVSFGGSVLGDAGSGGAAPGGADGGLGATDGGGPSSADNGVGASSGCGCRIGARAPGASWLGGSLAAIALTVASRRRRPRRS